MSGERGDCSRTRGLIDRLVAGPAGDDDRRHAAACPSCGPVVARAARFDSDLERSARRLIAEDLPRGILDPGLSGKVHVVPRMPALAPGVTAGVAALVVIVITTVVGFRPVLSPGQTQTLPPFIQIEAPGGSPLLSLGELTVALTDRLEYECGTADAPPAAAICSAPPDLGPFTAAVALEAASNGVVVRVTITAEIVGNPSQDKLDAVAAALAKVTAQAFTGRGSSIRAANFVFAKASQFSGPAWALGIEEGGVRVDLQRLADNAYIVNLSVAT